MDGRNILTVGIAYKPVRGGIAAVESVYSTFYKPFNHIATVTDGDSSKLAKLFQFGKALAKFLWWMIFHREIKIVHVHGASNASFWRKRILINIAKSFGKKVVFHLHGGMFQSFYAHHPKTVRKTIEKCDCVIALSEYWKQWLETTFNCKKVVIIKNAIETPRLHKIPHDTFNLLFLGLLGENKGIYDLLDVIIAHKKELSGKMQLLIGGNGEVDKVKSIIRQNDISDIAIYEGWVSGEIKRNLFNLSDALILPSYHEGVPITILEAESYELPIISTKVGGIPEIVEDGKNGILVDPGDKEAICHAIDKLMNNHPLAVMMGQSSSYIVEDHLANYVEQQLDTMYKKLIYKSGGDCPRTTA